MSLLEVSEGGDRLEVRSPMRPGLRIALVLLGAVPLLAPYELLLLVEWRSYLSPFFVLAALISAGAVVLSAVLVLGTLAGISSRLVFDRSASTVTYTYEAPVIRRTSRVYPLRGIARVEVEESPWSDGAPTYRLRVVMRGGAIVESGSSVSRDQVEAIRARVERLTTGDG